MRGVGLLARYEICLRCIMDTSDPNLSLDASGVCNHCRNFDTRIAPTWQASQNDSAKLSGVASQILSSSKDSEFNCIIGISGGLDSSYAAFVAKEKMNLRPLLVHVDAGWNTNQAVSNIAKIVDGLGLDLYTEVVNWEAVKKMQVAFLRSGIPDQDLVQDAAFFSILYRFAREHKIKHIITGSNYSTECCREPEEWGGYLGIDRTLFNDIWQRYGDGSRDSQFPIIDILVYKLWYQKILNMKVHHPLNLVPFIKVVAERKLAKEFGWEPFQHKHHESRFTRFYEDYWLPRRFGYDKRRAHFSSLILTQQMSRVAALERISRPEMGDHFLRQEFAYVASKLDMSTIELQSLFDGPKKTYRDFDNKRNIIKFGARLLSSRGLERRHLK